MSRIDETKLTILVLGVVLSLLAGWAFGAPPMSVTVGTSSTVVLPSRTIQGAEVWTTNHAYSQGDITHWTNATPADRYYLAIVAGTSSNLYAGAPTHNTGTATDGGTLTWYRIPKGQRKGAVVCNNSTNVVNGAYGGEAAVLNAGFRINANGGTVTLGAEDQGAFTVIGQDTADAMTVQEW